MYVELYIRRNGATRDCCRFTSESNSDCLTGVSIHDHFNPHVKQRTRRNGGGGGERSSLKGRVSPNCDTHSLEIYTYRERESEFNF